MPEKYDSVEYIKFYEDLFKSSQITKDNIITRIFKKPVALSSICTMCGNKIQDEKLRSFHKMRCRKAHLLFFTKCTILTKISSNALLNDSKENNSRLNKIEAKLESEINSETSFWWKTFKLNVLDCIMPKINNFKIIKPLTKGSFGQIFLMKDQIFGKEMVLKIISVSEAIQRSCIGFYVNEREILLQTTSKYIIDLYYSFRSEFFIYQIMEYVDSGDLSAHLEYERSFSEEVVKSILMQCIIALKDLQEKDIIHGDIKLENILYSKKDYQIKLADFGLAFYKNNTSNSGLGTPEYMAPEQVIHSIKGSQSDIWALGICTYEMLTGMPPFYEESAELILEKVISNQKISWESKDQSISSNMKDLVERMLDFNYKSRITTKEIMKHRVFDNFNWQNPAPVVLSDFDGVFERRNNRFNGLKFYNQSTIESETIAIEEGVHNQNTSIQNQVDLLKLFPIKNLNKMI